MVGVSTSRTVVVSLMRAGQAPTECSIRLPRAGQSGETSRIRAAPTTHEAYVHPSARTAKTSSGVHRNSRVVVLIVSFSSSS